MSKKQKKQRQLEKPIFTNKRSLELIGKKVMKESKKKK